MIFVYQKPNPNTRKIETQTRYTTFHLIMISKLNRKVVKKYYLKELIFFAIFMWKLDVEFIYLAVNLNQNSYSLIYDAR